MAYIRNKLQVITASGTTFDLSALADMPDYEVGDYVLIYINKRRAGAVAAADGYTNIFTKTQSTEIFSGAWYKKTTGTGETLPTVDSGQSFTSFQVTVLIIADADATTFVDVSANSGAASSAAFSFPTVTTTTDDCLLLHCATQYAPGSGNDFSAIPVNNDMTYVDHLTGEGNSTPVISIFSSYKETAGLTTARDIETTSADRYIVSTIAINNVSGGTVTPYKKQGFDRIMKWTSAGKAGYTYENFGDLVGATYGGVSASTGAVGPSEYQTVNTLDVLAFENENTTGWHGLVVDIGADVDFTDKLLNMTFAIASGSFSLGSSNFITLVLADNADNWRTFDVYPQSLLNDGSEITFFVDPINGTAADESGTAPDFTVLRKIGMARRSTTANSGNNISFGAGFIVDKNEGVIVGGSAGKPVDNITIAENFGAQDTSILSVNAQGTGQVLYPQSIQIGDGTLTTVTNFSGVSFETPRNYSVLDNRYNYNVGGTGGFAGISLYTSADDEVDFRDCIIASSVPGYFEINASSTAPNSFQTNGMQIRNCEVTWNSSFDVTSCRFVECQDIDFKAASITNVSVVNQAASKSTTIADGATLDTVSFEAGTASNYALTIAAAGDFTFTGVTFTGFTTDINVTAASGVVNITHSGGDTPTFTTAGATVNLLTPATTYTLQLPNIVDGSRFQIYNVTDDAELTNSTTSGGTGIDEEYTAGTDYTAGDTGRYRITYQSGTSAKESIEGTFTFGATTTTNSIPTAQVDQAIYNAFGLDGSTASEFSWDSGNIEVDINDTDNTTTVQRIGAWYYYFITTATGIDEAFGAIDWENINSLKIVTGTVDVTLDNTKAAALMLTGGRLYRDDDATIIASTSNSLQVDYDPVYQLETGVSGLTAGESALLSGMYNPANNVVEGTITYEEANRIILSAVAGKLSGAAGTTISIRDTSDTKDRIIATVDSDGNRTAVTLDGS